MPLTTWVQTIRKLWGGVNSYTGLYGNTVECDVRADYVYENQYGDIFGVLGNEIDKYIASMLNWTKLRKK